MASEFISPPFKLLPLLNNFNSAFKGVCSSNWSSWLNSVEIDGPPSKNPCFLDLICFCYFNYFWRGAKINLPLLFLLEDIYELFLGAWGFSKIMSDEVLPMLYSAGRRYYMCLSYWLVFFVRFYGLTNFYAMGGSCFFFRIIPLSELTDWKLLSTSDDCGKLSSICWWSPLSCLTNYF